MWSEGLFSLRGRLAPARQITGDLSDLLGAGGLQSRHYLKFLISTTSVETVLRETASCLPSRDQA